jgi:hypothetical protein
MDKNMQQITRQIISFAQGHKCEFDFKTISHAVDNINQGVKIQYQYKENAIKFLVDKGFFNNLGNGNYEIMPKVYSFTTWSAYKKNIVNIKA